ncbi:hypothetical protein [Streptodolium elevatio]|uniref:Secreted protein n=1 Tax=Streptodolium elevatio TaxID=3157996 RepID=A0ABV3DN73_9ACTN
MPHPSAPSTTTRRFPRGRHIVAALFGAAALASLGVVTAPSAGAATLPSGIAWDHIYSGPGVKVYVKEHGDMISVCDTSANGHAAWVAVDNVSDNISGYKLSVTTGKGTCATRQATQGGRYDLAEYSTIGMSYEGQGGLGSTYSAWSNDH